LPAIQEEEEEEKEELVVVVVMVVVSLFTCSDPARTADMVKSRKETIIFCALDLVVANERKIGGEKWH